jgi:hypothetical protein
LGYDLFENLGLALDFGEQHLSNGRTAKETVNQDLGLAIIKKQCGNAKEFDLELGRCGRLCRCRILPFLKIRHLT